MKISVIAHPNSKKPRIEKDLLDNLHVYVSEPPLEGRANAAIARSLAKYFSVGRNSIILISGDRSRNKVFKIITSGN